MKYILPITALCSAVLLTACGDDDAAVNEAVKGSISLSGTARVNETLSITNDYKDRNGIEKNTPSYQWYEDGMAIVGATDATIALTTDQLNKDVHVKIDFLDDDGFAETLTSDSMNVFYAYTISMAVDREETIGITQSEDFGKTWGDASVPMVTDIAERHYYPSIATDGQGNLVTVSVTEYNPSYNGGYDVVVSSSQDNGATWSDIKLLVPAGLGDTQDDDEPQVATDKSGNWMVVWSSREDYEGAGDTDYDIFYVTSIDNGITWTAPKPLNPFATTDSAKDISPQLSMHEANWVVTWSSEHDMDNALDTDTEIYTMHSADNGLIWSDPKKVSKGGENNATADTSPQLQINELGRGLLIWSGRENGTDSDIYSARTTNFGKDWTAGIVVNDDADTDEDAVIDSNNITFNDMAANVLASENGIYVASWYGRSPETGADDEAFYAYSLDSGSSWSDARVLNKNSTTDTEDEFAPKFLTKPDNTWVASWVDDLGKVWIVESENLITWSTPVLLAEDSDENIAWVLH